MDSIVNAWLGKTMVILSKWPQKYVFAGGHVYHCLHRPHPVRFGGQLTLVTAAVILITRSPAASP